MSREKQKQRTRIVGLADQCRAGMRSLHPDIRRIANGGLRIHDGRDLDIVQMVFCAVSGDLHVRAVREAVEAGDLRIECD